MDQQTCRAQMRRLIEAETAALKELAILLEREYGHLKGDEAEALTGVIHERHQCVARILGVDEERRGLCRTLGRPHDLKGLESLLAWCDPQGTLKDAWLTCTSAATNCRELNDRNAVMAAARLQNVQARLGALIEGRRETVTYGPRGTCSVGASGYGLRREA